MVKDGITLFLIGLAARFNTMVHKQIVTKNSTGATTSQHGGQRITRFGLGGREELG